MEEELQLKNEIRVQEEVDKDTVVGGSGADIDANYVNENIDYVIKENQRQEMGDEEEDDNDYDNDEEDDEEEDKDEYYEFDSKNNRKRFSGSDVMKHKYIVVNRIC